MLLYGQGLDMISQKCHILLGSTEDVFDNHSPRIWFDEKFFEHGTRESILVAIPLLYVWFFDISSQFVEVNAGRGANSLVRKTIKHTMAEISFDRVKPRCCSISVV